MSQVCFNKICKHHIEINTLRIKVFNMYSLIFYDIWTIQDLIKLGEHKEYPHLTLYKQLQICPLLLQQRITHHSISIKLYYLIRKIWCHFRVRKVWHFIYNQSSDHANNTSAGKLQFILKSCKLLQFMFKLIFQVGLLV